MKADVQYNDFYGTVAADIADSLGMLNGNDLESIGDGLNIDKERFKVIGLSIYGTEDFLISLICIDKNRSTDEKEFIVKMRIDSENVGLEFLFKRLHIVLHEKFDKKYPNLGYDEEVKFSYYHNLK